GHDADLAVVVRTRDTHGARLAEAIRGVIVARAAALPFRSIAAFAGTAAMARRAGFEALLDVELTLDPAQITLFTRVVTTEHDVWADALGHTTIGATASAVVTRVKIDSELLAYLETPPSPTAVAATTMGPATTTAARTPKGNPAPPRA